VVLALQKKMQISIQELRWPLLNLRICPSCSIAREEAREMRKLTLGSARRKAVALSEHMVRDKY
jgi:hypothetical protein